MIISYIPITAISVESGESVVDGSTAGAPIAVPEEGLAQSNKAVLNLFILTEQALLWELLWKDLHLQFLHKKNYLQKESMSVPNF